MHLPAFAFGTGGHINVPSLSKTGLFFIGPKKPSGNAFCADQVIPPSADVFIKPFQVDGLGPIL
jgi:hypothetical protein